MNINELPLIMGVAGLVAAFVVYRLVISYPSGSGKVVDISVKIQQGSMAFMRREYLLLWGVGVLIIIAIGVGLLGAFTTFSTFSIETLNLLEQADYLKAFLNVLISVIACIGAAMIGVLIARQL